MHDPVLVVHDCCSLRRLPDGAEAGVLAEVGLGAVALVQVLALSCIGVLKLNALRAKLGSDAAKYRAAQGVWKAAQCNVGTAASLPQCCPWLTLTALNRLQQGSIST